MCHGQIVSQKILRARRDNKCSNCGRLIPRGRRFWFGTVHGFDDGLLFNYSLCPRCMAAQEDAHESGACLSGVEARDEAYCAVKARGWRWLRAQFSRVSARASSRRARAASSPSPDRGQA